MTWRFALLLAAVTGTYGAEVSQEQIVSDALAHSPRLKALDLETVAAKARMRQAGARRYPRVDVDAAARKYDGLEDSSIAPGSLIPGIEDRYYAGIALTQPVFTGGRVSGQKRSAELQSQAALERREASRADLMLQAMDAYWSWSRAHHVLASLRASVDRMSSHTRDMQNQRAAGLVTDNDALAAEVLLDQTRLQMEQARRRESLARATIEFLTGGKLPPDAVPRQAPDLETVPMGEEEASVGNARLNRAEIKAGQLDRQSAEANVDVSRSDFYPQVSLLARYEQAHPNPLDFPPREEWNDDVFVGAALSWNLVDWGLTRGKAEESRARAQEAECRLLAAQEEVDLQVRQARIDVLSALDRLRVAKQAEQSARRNLAVANDLQQSGMIRNSEVLDAHENLTRAEFDVIAARTDVVMARAELEYAQGALGRNAQGAP
jgi:outer membrane protein TolC